MNTQTKAEQPSPVSQIKKSKDLSTLAIAPVVKSWLSRFYEIKEWKLQLDMTRGIPSPAQIELSIMLPVHNVVVEPITAKRLDCRNYGGDISGLYEAKILFAAYFGLSKEKALAQVFVGDNSSLALMYDVLASGLHFGMPDQFGKMQPWCPQGQKPKMICPVPGYDRHFKICELLGIEMIPVDLTYQGPDMEKVAKLVGEDSSIIGIWCVPQHSNPTGITYSNDVVQVLALMETANPRFRIFWDLAYAIHHLDDRAPNVWNIRDECNRNRNWHRPFVFGSTSKITFAGSGIAAMTSSKVNLQWFGNIQKIRTIGPNKANQLAHVRFLKNRKTMLEHMLKHRELLKPKFDAVHDALANSFNGSKWLGLEYLGAVDPDVFGSGITWTKPFGGYFISLNVPEGCAKRVVQLAGILGVKLTPAGATFPYGNDPMDSNIRIAPSYPELEDIKTAMPILVLVIRIAVEEKRLGRQLIPSE